MRFSPSLALVLAVVSLTIAAPSPVNPLDAVDTPAPTAIVPQGSDAPSDAVIMAAFVTFLNSAISEAQSDEGGSKLELDSRGCDKRGTVCSILHSNCCSICYPLVGVIGFCL